MQEVTTDKRIDALMEAARRNHGIGNLKNAIDVLFKIVDLLREQIASKADAPTTEELESEPQTLPEDAGGGAEPPITGVVEVGDEKVSYTIDADVAMQANSELGLDVETEVRAGIEKALTEEEAAAEPATEDDATEGEEKAAPKRGGRPKAGSK